MKFIAHDNNLVTTEAEIAEFLAPLDRALGVTTHREGSDDKSATIVDMEVDPAAATTVADCLIHRATARGSTVRVHALTERS